MAFKRSLFQQVLPIALLLLFCAITVPASADHSFDINPNPSPEASTSLVCPNDNPLDCYPALFQPTLHFQKIRPNQSLPPGLHVRMNIQTGEKEARLNVPEEPEANAEAIIILDDEDVPYMTRETALGVVDNADDPLHLRLPDTPKQAEHARPYAPPDLAVMEDAGGVVPGDNDERSSYNVALSSIRKSSFTAESGVHFPNAAADAFETLTELSHSVDWGLTVCRDLNMFLPPLKTIFWTDSSYQPEWRSAISLLLATATQNNPEALNALLDREDPAKSSEDLISMMISSIGQDGLLVDEGDGYPRLLSRQVFFLSQLCSGEGTRNYCLDLPGDDNGGWGAFQTLLELFSGSSGTEVEDKMKLKHRIANFVEDHVEDVAAFYMAHQSEDWEQVAGAKIRVYRLLQPWCKALRSDVSKRREDKSFRSLEAARQVSKVLVTYCGEGCIDTWEEPLKEL